MIWTNRLAGEWRRRGGGPGVPVIHIRLMRIIELIKEAARD